MDAQKTTLLYEVGQELRFPYVDDRDPEAARRLRDLAVPRDRGLAGKLQGRWSTP